MPVDIPIPRHQLQTRDEIENVPVCDELIRVVEQPYEVEECTVQVKPEKVLVDINHTLVDIVQENVPVDVHDVQLDVIAHGIPVKRTIISEKEEIVPVTNELLDIVSVEVKKAVLSKYIKI